MKIISSDRLLNVKEGAKYLLGCEIVRTLDSGEVLRARIVETEAYHQNDPASHSFHGISPRNQVMFGEPGRAYIYFTYGMHWCFNVTAERQGSGAGILVRAAEPLHGLKTMQSFRKGVSEAQLTNGPAKLAQALCINKNLYGHDLSRAPLQLFEPETREFSIVETTRIGITKAVDEIARFYIKGSPFISQK